MHTVEYRGPNGDPFPVTFATAADAERRWEIDLEHVPQAMTPLAAAVHPEGRAGRERAYAESDVTMPTVLRRDRPQANGYEYTPAFGLAEDERALFQADVERLEQAHGGSASVWAHHSLPAVRRGCGDIDAAPIDLPFSALAALRDYVWSHTGVAGAVSRLDERAVIRLCRDQFGARASSVTHALTQGRSNDTMRADAELWQLAHQDPLPAAAAARLAFLEEHGARAVSWPIDHPTLQERPELLDVQLRLLRESGGREPGRVAAEAAVRREELVGELRRFARSSADRIALEHHVRGLESFVAVREARARWQLVASGAMRAAVRRRGFALVEQGALATVDEVFFLLPAEYDDPSGISRADLATRRADHAHWSRVTPPSWIGAAGEDRAQAAGGELHGAPGSPGRVTGRARVILDLADAERLQPGDVLVATMTSPPWTPLFGVAAAVVTDAGDAISHVAIAAREYGIPCVVATGTATTQVRDGQWVTVDGDTGVVILDAPTAAR